MTRDRVEEAYRHVHTRLWRALFAYAGDPDVASDAEAEAFTQAIRGGSNVRDVESWVWSTAFRIAGGLLNERQTKTSLDVNQLDGRGAVTDVSVAEFVSQLGGLSDQQRAVVVLRYVGEFRPAEIAELLGTSPGTVRVQLHRAHAHLRVILEKTDGR